MACNCNRIFEDLMNVKARDRNNCCEVEFRGREREMALKEQLNRERVQCCQKVVEANACCCRLNGVTNNIRW